MFNKVKSIFGKNSKRLKSVLASVLLSVGCAGTSLANPKSVSLSTEKQIEKNRNLVNTYDVMQIVDMMNNNKKEVGGTLALIIASIFGYKKVAPKVSDYMVRRALDKIQDVNGVSDEVLNIANSIIEKYLKIGKRKEIINNAKESKFTNETKEKELSKLQLSADEWFTRLGGTQKDIDGYREPDLSKISEMSEEAKKQIKNDFKVIEGDVPRSNIWKNDTNYNQKIALLDEILKKFEIEEFQGYTQGYNFIALVVIRKFTENDKKMGEGEQFSKEKKAKIYYVFKKIVQTMVNYSIGKNGIDDNNWSQILKRLYDRMLLSFCKGNSVNEIDKCLFLSEFRGGVVCPAICLLFLTSESQIFLWDSIISEVKDGKFDPNLALEKLFDVWFARALQLQEDFYNDKNLDDKGIIGLFNFMKNNPI